MNSGCDSDEYHRFLQFLILDLHKSEVGPSNIFFFFFFSKNLFFSKIISKIFFFLLFQRAINVTVSPVSRFSLPRVLDTGTTS